MTIVYQRTQNRRTCIWSAMRGVPCLAHTKLAVLYGELQAAATLTLRSYP
jgi:hypothetical protein